MVTARTTAPPVRRTTRGATKVVAPTVPGSGEDGLADQLNRVLRITQPQEKVPKLRNPPLAKASSIKATVTAGPSKTPARPSKTDKPVATKKVVARAAPPTSLKGKEKQVVLAEEEPLPWETSASGTPLRPTERAKLASAAINTSLKSLSAAVQSGYRYGALPPARKPVEGAMEEIWTDVRIMALVETGEAGLKALRGIEKEGGIGDRAVQIEQAGQTLVVRCLALGMVSDHRPGADELIWIAPPGYDAIIERSAIYLAAIYTHIEEYHPFDSATFTSPPIKTRSCTGERQNSHSVHSTSDHHGFQLETTCQTPSSIDVNPTGMAFTRLVPSRGRWNCDDRGGSGVGISGIDMR